MENPNFFNRPPFWYFFIIVIILSLFVYGMSLEHNKSELAILKSKLDSVSAELNNQTQISVTKDGTIAALKSKIDQQTRWVLSTHDTILILQGTVRILKDSVSKLLTRKPEVITQFRDRKIFVDKPEPDHQFGKGYGKIVVYSMCGFGRNTTVWIDGQNCGSFDKYYKTDPGCNASICVSKNVISGKHHIQARNNMKYWDFYTVVYEDYCKPVKLGCDN